MGAGNLQDRHRHIAERCMVAATFLHLGPRRIRYCEGTRTEKTTAHKRRAGQEKEIAIGIDIPLAWSFVNASSAASRGN